MGTTDKNQQLLGRVGVQGGREREEESAVVEDRMASDDHAGLRRT